MLQLLLLRHAKSSRDDPAIADIDRPLTPRGERDASRIGKMLEAKELFPERILCSTARRTRETLAQVLPHLSGEAEVEFRDDLYNAAGRGYLEIIAANGGAAQRVLVVGHNPATQQTAQQLIGSGDPELVAAMAAGFPTSAVAVVEFDVRKWEEVTPDSGRIVTFIQRDDE
ncbi:MAG: histidine phosphatase superfamily branch 1 [Hyphomicrobiales bacterium]|nr:histidine phosphatase superfamily branch 1 [Hyphomicrobiales bacterium]